MKRFFVFLNLFLAAQWLLAIFAEATVLDPCVVKLAGQQTPPHTASRLMNPPNRSDDRRVAFPYLPHHWAWDVTGLDLIRDDARLNHADYADTKLSIVDTGLLLRGNPGAGAKLIANSPERDYDPKGHGTGVVGVATSELHGVNPRVNVLAVPTVYYESGTIDSIANMMMGREGIDVPSLLLSIRTAVNDPATKVINASLSILEIPEMLDLFKEAMRKGKWVVVPPANSNQKVNDRHNAGMVELLKFPEFFVVGALSYYGAPASFAHRGPETQYYAPGTEVETLSNRYNPNLVESPRESSFDGGSFASPQFATLLTTLRALVPDLDANTVRQILDQTSIQRGTLRTITQVNNYFAIWLGLKVQEQRAQRVCEKLDQCLALAVGAARSEAARIEALAANNYAQGWFFGLEALDRLGLRKASGALQTLPTEQRMNQLRIGYFLSRGAKAFSQRILALLPQNQKTKWAEFAYYSVPEAALSVLQQMQTQSRAQENNLEAAIAFYSGRLNIVSTAEDHPIPGVQRQGPQVNLKDLPSRVENIPAVLRIARDVLHGESDRLGVEDYLDDSPDDVLMGIGHAMIEDPHFSFVTLGAYVSNRARNDEEAKMGRELLNRAAHNWSLSGDVSSLDTLVARIESLAPATRDDLLAQFIEHRHALRSEARSSDFQRKKLETLEMILYSWASPKYFEPKRQKVVAWKSKDVSPAVGQMSLAFRRWEAGYLSNNELMSAIGHALTEVSGLTGEAKYRSGGSSIAYVLTHTASRDPGLALQIADRLADPAVLRALPGCGMGYEVLAQLSGEIIKGVPDDTGAELLELMLDAWKGVGYKSELLVRVLGQSKDRPSAQAVVTRVLQSPQNDPGMQTLRVAMLEIRAQLSTSHTPEIDAYLREAEGGVHNIHRLSSSVVAHSKDLLRRFEENLGKARDCDGGCHEDLRWLASPNTADDFHRIATVMMPHLARVWRNSSYFMDYDAGRLAGLLASYEGNNTDLIATAMSQAKELWLDAEFMSRFQRADDKDLEYGNKQDEAVVHFVEVLALSVAGTSYLKRDPQWLQDIVRHVVSNPTKFYFSHDHYLPQIFREALREQLPSTANIRDLDRLPRWMEMLLEQDIESLPQILKYLSDPVLSSQLTSGLKHLAYCLKKLVSRHPQVRDRVEIFISENQNPNVQNLKRIVFL